MRVETAKKWQKRVRRWKRSGLTAEEFAEGEGLSPRSLTWWSWRLRKAEREGELPVGRRHVPSDDEEELPEIGRSVPAEAAAPLLRFLPVQVHEDSQSTEMARVASEPLEIHLPNGRMVVARPGVDPEWLSEMLGGIARSGTWNEGC